MDPALKLYIAVGLLTRPSKHRLVGADGTARWVEADPLLVQLRMAVGNSTAAAEPGVSSSGKPIPMSADAHDLLERIGEELTRHWWYTHPIHKGRGRETMVGKLLAWTAAARSSEVLVLRAGSITGRWVADIEALFNPQRRKPLPGAACPAKGCGAVRVLDREEEGEHFYRPALVRVYDNAGQFTHLECGACGGTWNQLAMELLAP